MNQDWEIPQYDKYEFSPKKENYCVCIFVINEGQKLIAQLEKMKAHTFNTDIIIADGGSTDGSTESERLKKLGVNTLLVKAEDGKLGTQMRMAYSWAIDRGYKGVVVIDGNGKDGVEAIPSFVEKLEQGYDHIQGSRFIPGGVSSNLPLSRWIGLTFIHVPLMRIASNFPYTDTTNGFRAYSSKFLADEKVSVFRHIFTGYELHYYLAIQAARRNFSVIETPISRCYPAKGKTPTKISPIKGNLGVIKVLLKAVFGCYDKKK